MAVLRSVAQSAFSPAWRFIVVFHVFGANAVDSARSRMVRILRVVDVPNLLRLAHFEDGIGNAEVVKRRSDQRPQPGAEIEHLASPGPGHAAGFERLRQFEEAAGISQVEVQKTGEDIDALFEPAQAGSPRAHERGEEALRG